MVKSDFSSKIESRRNITIQHKKIEIDKDFNKYEKYTFPRVTYQQLLSKGCAKVILSKVIEDDKIIAVCLSAPSNKSTITIFSFFVDPYYRNQGVGSSLLNSVVKKIRSSDFNKIKLSYKSFWTGIDAWESLLKTTKWNITTSGIEYIKVDNLLELKSSHLMRMTLPVDQTEIVHLDQQKLSQLEGWLSLAGIDNVPSDVRPAKHLYNNICSASSLLLLIDKQVAGWIISDQISDDTIQVGSLFILPKYSKEYKNLGKALIAELIRRNFQPYEVYFGIRDSNHFMKRFVERELGACASTYHQKQATISLS